MIQQLQQLHPAVAITLIIGCVAVMVAFFYTIFKILKEAIQL